MYTTHEHQSLYDTTRKFVESELNPHVKEWEEAGIWPAREILKKMGDLGLLGIAKPEEVGGLGLDYSYQVAFAEALGHCDCGGLPMAIGVQTDMATPALARFGSDYLKENYPEAGRGRRHGRRDRRQRSRCRFRCRRHQDRGAPGR